ncbi:MAG TPA: vWA domain-containing protein [Polyangiaceae bacterium]
MNTKYGVLGFGCLVAALVGCGGSGGSNASDGDDGGNGNGSGGTLPVTSDGSGGVSSSVTGTGGASTGGLFGPSNNATSNTSSGGTGINPEPPEACTPAADDSGCVGATFEGESIPLDIYVMFDLSCSMSCNVDHSGCCRESRDPDPLEEWRIQPVREAMRTFLRDPMSAGISVGLGFFGDHDVNNNEDPQVCTVEAHSDAAVPIKKLPGAADELIAELDAGEPQGGTPTHLAIDGACSYATGWRTEHPGRKVVVLLVTDGIPEHSCDADIRKATSAAEGCYDSGDGLQTYVLGVVANNHNSLDQLNDIAEAGGTERAYLTDTDDVAGSVLEALNAIRADAVIPCDLNIPPPPDGETLNPAKVNLGVCDAAGDVVVTPYVGSQGDCDGPGWYYDDPNSPETIHLCEVTCDTVSIAGSSLFFSVGCDTQIDDPIK